MKYKVGTKFQTTTSGGYVGTIISIKDDRYIIKWDTDYPNEQTAFDTIISFWIQNNSVVLLKTFDLNLVCKKIK